MEWKDKLIEGKEKTKLKCIAVALENTPPNVTVIEIRKNLTGRAWIKSGKIAVPRPFTRKALYIFLHECAHMTLHAKRKKARHVEEMEAEKWAHQKMRDAGIAVPRSMTKSAKEYVGWKIEQAEKRGAKKIDSEARRFSK